MNHSLVKRASVITPRDPIFHALFEICLSVHRASADRFNIGVVHQALTTYCQCEPQLIEPYSKSRGAWPWWRYWASELGSQHLPYQVRPADFVGSKFLFII
jgi:hypothetical protein